MYEFFLSEVGWVATHAATQNDWGAMFDALSWEYLK